MAEVIKIEISNGSKNQGRKAGPAAAVFVFFLIAASVIFYDSRKVLLWETQRENGKQTLFQKGAIAAAETSEKIKNRAGISGFFEKENEFWAGLKESPEFFSGTRGQYSGLAAGSDWDSQAVPKGEAPSDDLDAGENAETAGTGNSAGNEKTVSKDPAEPALPENGESATDIRAEAKTVPIAIKEEKPLPEALATATTTPAPVAAAPTSTRSLARKEEKPAKPPESPEKLAPPLKILIIGDSFVAVGGGLGDPLERTLLNYRGVTVARKGRVSSGLARQDYFNWHSTALALAEQHNPNVAILMFGSNDTQAVTAANGGIVAGYGGKNWDREYKKRLAEMIDIFERKKAKVFVLGLPCMRNANLSAQIAHINELIKSEALAHKNAEFIPVWNLVSDKNGNYTDYLPDAGGRKKLARTADGVHFQYFTGYLVSSAIIDELGKTLFLKK